MKKHLFYFLISCLFLACTSPEKEAGIIMEQFTSSLNDIGDVANLTAQELSQKIRACREKVDEMVANKRKEFTKPEKRERFDNAISINDNEPYLSLRQELANKNLKSIESVKGKKWINIASSSVASIFTLDETCISFLNLKNKFEYSIEDGDIIFFNDCGINPLYFTLEGDKLIIANSQGQTSSFREATFEDIIQATWFNPNDRVYGFVLKKNKKYRYFGSSSEDTYTFKNKVITRFVTANRYNKVEFSYKYLSNDKLRGEDGDEYVRKQAIGPDCLTFLFDGKIKSNAKVETTSSTSSSASSSNTDNDWDSILDDYEEYYDRYIKLMKKAKNGDVSAMTEYVTMLEKAQSIGEKLSAAQDDLTASQSARFLKIQQKLMNAALEL